MPDRDLTKEVFAIEEACRAVTIVLDEPCYRYVELEGKECLSDRSDLPLTPICKDKVWQSLLLGTEQRFRHVLQQCP